MTETERKALERARLISRLRRENGRLQRAYDDRTGMVIGMLVCICALVLFCSYLCRRVERVERELARMEAAK